MFPSCVSSATNYILCASCSRAVVSQAHAAGQDKRAGLTKKEENEVTGLGSGGYLNPLGRASTAGPIAPAGADQAEKLARGSIVGVKKSTLSPGSVQLGNFFRIPLSCDSSSICK